MSPRYVARQIGRERSALSPVGRPAAARCSDEQNVGGADHILALQRTAGNRAVASLLGRSVQRRGGDVVQRDGRAPAGSLTPAQDPYRPLTDEIAAVRQSGSVLRAAKLQVLRKLEELVKAVEQKDLAAVRTATSDFVTLDTANPLDSATAVMLSDVPMVLVSRIFLLGLTAESQRLEGHFFQTMRSSYRQPWSSGGFNVHYVVLDQVVQEVVAGAKFDGPAGAERTIDLALIAFKGLNDAAAQLDLAQVRKERDAAQGETGLPTDRARTPGGFYSALMALVPPLVEVVQRGFQVLMDAAVSELQAGTGATALATAKAVLTTKITPVATAFDVALTSGKRSSFGLPRPLTVDVDVTRSDFKKKPRRHLDYFDRSDQAVSVEIEAYEKGEVSFGEKSLEVGRTIAIREAQIATLERLFGLAVDSKTGKVTAESKQNAEAVRGVRGFKLHDNDSWRSFLLKKFRAALKETGDDWKALIATVKVLQSYLSSFTIHTPYNIAEFGDNYLTRTFPRALTGQLIHDCGVYALRVAYALSLVREKLGLTFRAAVMPVHVGLVISFGDNVSKGALYVNNDQIDVLSGTELGQFADQWSKTDTTGRPRSQPAALEVDKLHAAIAAFYYGSGVDVPVRLVDVPTSPSNRSAAVNKGMLWEKFYHQKVIKPPAVAPAKGTPQPELIYLDFLGAVKRVHNTFRVPLYWAAHAQFNRDQKDLIAAQANLSSPDAAVREAARKTLASHRDKLIKLFKPLTDELPQLDKRAAEVDEFMRSHPEAVGHDAQLQPAARLGYIRDAVIFDYLGDETHLGLLMSGQIIPDGWADEGALPRRVD